MRCSSLLLAFVLAGCGAAPSSCLRLQVDVAVRGADILGDGASAMIRTHFGDVSGGGRAYYELFHRAIPAAEDTLRKAYRDRGFIDVRIHHPEAELDGDSVHVTFTLEERTRYKVGAVRISSDDPAGAPRDLLGVVPGEWFSEAALDRAREGIAEPYRDAGYAMARVRARYARHSERGIVDLDVAIERGAICTIDALGIVDAVRGRVPENFERLGLAVGDRYSERAVQGAMRALQRAHPHRIVRYEVVPTSDDRDRVRVNFLLFLRRG